MGRMGLGVAVGCAVVTCAIAAALVGRRARSWWRWARVVGVVGQFEEDCATPVWKLRQVVDAMVVEMHAGLASDGGSKLKMLLTFVDTLPDGYRAYQSSIGLVCTERTARRRRGRTIPHARCSSSVPLRGPSPVGDSFSPRGEKERGDVVFVSWIAVVCNLDHDINELIS
ncbi:hypothetical protein BHM03_00033433 [Ensete ventricosum]|nr:hypothetical protein BHM03_00033433 [Ensete ventricosum]